MLTPRFLAMPAIALTVIVMLAQAHSQPDVRRAEIVTPAAYHSVNKAIPDFAALRPGYLLTGR